MLERFHESRSPGIIGETKTCWTDSLIVRHKVQIAMMDDEKLRESDMVQQEVNTLSWLHTVAPAFPINGSKARV